MTPMLPWFALESVFQSIWSNVNSAWEIISDEVILYFAVAVLLVGSIIDMSLYLTDFETGDE